MAAMTSFQLGKCYHLLSENEASAVRQFLIYSTFIVVSLLFYHADISIDLLTN